MPEGGKKKKKNSFKIHSNIQSVISVKAILLLYPQHPAEGKDGNLLALETRCA